MTVADDEAALRGMLDQVRVVEIDGDVDGFMALMTDDAIMMPPGQAVVIGADDIRAWWHAALEQVGLDVTSVVGEEVQVEGDLACVRVSYSHVATIKADGSEQPEKGKSIWIAKRQQGSTWKFSRVIWNTDE